MFRFYIVLCLGVLGVCDAARAESLAERGGYLVNTIMACGNCHSPRDANGQLIKERVFSGGLAFNTPAFTATAPNITPDRETGIGDWTADEFVAAMHDGRGRGGMRLYPAMPYPAYTKMTRDDVLLIRAYLATVKPVHNAVVANQLPFPLNIRANLLFWNFLNFTPGRFQANPQKSAEWNRGAYIVEGAGHCGTCHTPKTLLGGDKIGTPLAGATLQGWFAPNITTDPRKGIGNWSHDDLAAYLKTGTNDWTLASGPMAEAVVHSTSKMTAEDVAAIATYLKDSGAAGDASSPAVVSSDDKAMRVGLAIYKDSCAACHKDSGLGESDLFPRLAGSALVQSDDPTTLVRVVLQGTRAVSTSAKPTFGQRAGSGSGIPPTSEATTAMRNVSPSSRAISRTISNVWSRCGLAPADPAGVSQIGPIVMTPDGRSYIYGYHRTLSDLYLVEGLK